MRLELIGGPGYGAWYTLIDDLAPHSIVYSFGVGTDVTWDLELIRRFGCRVYAYDPNPIAAAYVASLSLPAQFIYQPVGIAAYDGFQRFYGKKGKISTSTVKKLGESTRLPVCTLQTLMHRNGHASIDLLKLDIEGSEFSIVPKISALPIRQLLVEVHTSFYTQGLWGFRRWWGERKAAAMFAELIAHGFIEVHREKENHTFIRTSGVLSRA
jgi:FkbM family methyltransferase